MSQWPTSVASDANLYIAVDYPNSLTFLSGAINSSVTTIAVTNASNYPSSGGFILIDAELITFTGKALNTLTGCTRGVDGTSATSHINGAVVNMVSVAEHHNVLKDEIIALETSLNLTPSKALISNGSGRVDVSSTTSTELGYVSGVTSSIQTQLNGKQASLGYTPVNKAGDSMSGNLTLLSQHAIIFNDSEGSPKSVTMEAPSTLTNTWTLTLPVAAGSSGQVLSTDGSGNTSWVNAAGGGTINSGTQYQLAYYATTGTTISGDSNITTNVNNQLLATDGTASLPGYSFSSNINSGLYRVGTNDIALSTNGIKRLEISTTAITASLPLAMSSNKITGLANGTASTDAAAFGQLTDNYVQSVSDIEGLTTGTTVTTQSITTTGGPVLVMSTVTYLIHNGTIIQFQVRRGSTPIVGTSSRAYTTSGGDSDVTSSGLGVDVVGAGTYTYTLCYQTVGSTTIFDYGLILIELKP